MKSFFEGTKYFCEISDVYTRYARKGHSRTQSPRTKYELIYKISGSSDQIFPDMTLRLLPDHLYFIPINHPENEIHVDVEGDIINVKFTLLGCSDEDEFVPELFPLESNNDIKPLFEQLLDVWTKKKIGRYFEAQSILQAIFAAVAKIRNQSVTQTMTYRRILPALELMEKEYGRSDISTSELTELCGISGEYLRQLFQTYTGKSPMIYLRDLRLSRAREILLSGTMGIAETAYTCGFTDSKYFTRVFRKKYGIPPSHVEHETVG